MQNSDASESPHSERPNLLLLWLKCHAIAAVAAIVSLYLTTYALTWGSLSTGLIIGGSTGILQAYVLKRRIPRLRYWQWILANILGGYGGFFLGIIAILLVIDLPVSVLARFALGLSYGAAIGISVGFTEMVVLLLHTPVKIAVIWGLMTLIGRSLGWACGGALYFLMFGDLAVRPAIPYLLGIIPCVLVGGTVYSLISGWVLLRVRPKIPRDRTAAG